MRAGIAAAGQVLAQTLTQAEQRPIGRSCVLGRDNQVQPALDEPEARQGAARPLGVLTRERG